MPLVAEVALFAQRGSSEEFSLRVLPHRCAASLFLFSAALRLGGGIYTKAKSRGGEPLNTECLIKACLKTAGGVSWVIFVGSCLFVRGCRCWRRHGGQGGGRHPGGHVLRVFPPAIDSIRLKKTRNCSLKKRMTRAIRPSSLIWSETTWETVPGVYPARVFSPHPSSKRPAGSKSCARRRRGLV